MGGSRARHYYVRAYVCTDMARKVNKTLSLPLEVVEQLEDENNQSATVERALRAYWDDTE